MAKQAGIMPITGTLGNINFYKDDEGRLIARTKPGPSGNKVKHDAVFEKTRQQNAAFKRATGYGALIRRAFHTLIRHCEDSNMHYTLMQRIYQIMKMDNTCEVDKMDLRKETLVALRHFELDSKSLSRQYFEKPVIADADNGVLEVTVKPVLSNLPAGATAWKLKSVAACIDFANKKATTDYKESPLVALAADNNAIHFTHAFDEQLFLFYGVCITFYGYDAVIDEYRALTEKHVNSGCIRYVPV